MLQNIPNQHKGYILFIASLKFVTLTFVTLSVSLILCSTGNSRIQGTGRKSKLFELSQQKITHFYLP